MDDKQFKEKLSQIADWYIPIVSETSKQGFTRKPMPKSDVNTTIGPTVERLYECLQPCGWCNKIVDQKTTHKRIYDSKGKFTKWSHECVTCRSYYDPLTGKIVKKSQANKKPKAVSAKQKYWWNEGIGALDDNKLG